MTTIQELSGFTGKLLFDASKPNGIIKTSRIKSRYSLCVLCAFVVKKINKLLYSLGFRREKKKLTTEAQRTREKPKEDL